MLPWFASFELDVAPLVAFAAGNFLYIGASDLSPEVNRPHTPGASVLRVLCVTLGMGLLLALRAAFGAG